MHNRSLSLLFVTTVFLGVSPAFAAESPGITQLEEQFRTMPMEARRLTGPLFWMHGDESREQLEAELKNVVEGHNGTFTTEPRPHKDWLGEGWYRDLGICLDFARKNNLTMFIYDDWWWPSQMMGGRVPPQYGSKLLRAVAVNVTGPAKVEEAGYQDAHLIAVVAGKQFGEGTIDGQSLVNLTPLVHDGKLTWNAPTGKWRIMKFFWEFKGNGGGQQSYISVDGASPECVEWFIKTVYQPHYDRFKDDFGKTIVGYFYDEPETQGDWGSDVPRVIAERKLDLLKLLVAYKFKLAGDEQTAAHYSYLDCFAEAWGRTMYGGMNRWCREHKVVSMGHFMEHGDDFFRRDLSGGNMMQLQKFSGMGGIDLVCHQVYPGQRKMGLYQMPKIASSISHTYNKDNDIAFCEIFGGYDQRLTYPNMKWLVDWEQVRGVNYLVTHSFNPRAPHDTDFPPYFNNGGYEPRWPLYRVWADYTNRLSLMLTGGRHVCPVAFLHVGQSYHVGRSARPEEMTSSLQDAQYDCDWLLYDAWENDSKLEGAHIKLHKEEYQVLVLPAAEVIPYPTLAKARQFFDNGGVVIAYGILPAKSATLGHDSHDIARHCEAIFGKPTPGLLCCKTNDAGGRSYFLPKKPSAEQIHQVLASDANKHPALEVVGGKAEWLHVLHRQKAGRDLFFVCNQDHQGSARRFTFRITASGEPECWDPMRGEVNSIAYRRIDAGTVELDITLEPSESVLLVFQTAKRVLPVRLEGDRLPIGETIPLVRDQAASEALAAKSNKPAEKLKPFNASPVKANPLVGRFELPAGTDLAKSRVYLVCQGIKPEQAASVSVNGQYAGGFIERPLQLDVTAQMRPGVNEIRIEPFAPKTAGLVVVPNPGTATPLEQNEGLLSPNRFSCEHNRQSLPQRQRLLEKRRKKHP